MVTVLKVVMIHSWNPSTGESKTRETLQIQGHPGLHNEILSLKQSNRKKKLGGFWKRSPRVGLCELKPNLVSISSSRKDRTTQTPLSQTKQNGSSNNKIRKCSQRKEGKNYGELWESGDGNVAQKQSGCLVCSKSWVQCSAPKQQENTFGTGVIAQGKVL